jgi:PHD/YefM family antitoxin component YafN of YafNO toxin-antitoxin module
MLLSSRLSANLMFWEEVAMIELQNIRSLTDFQRNTAQFLTQMKQNGQPLVLTVNGKAELIVQDAQSYQKLLDDLEHLKSVEALIEGLHEFEQGKGQPAREALNQLRRRLNVQG